MFRPIDSAARGALLKGSITVAIAGLVAAPVAGSDYTAKHHRVTEANPPIVRSEDPWRSALIAVSRDPFYAQPVSITGNPIPLELGNRSIVGTRVVRGQPILDAEASGVSLRGIISGSTARAIIDAGTGTRIVSPGAYVDGTRVRAILDDRVVLENGLVLRLRAKSP